MRLWNTPTTARPAPRKSSASASTSERRAGEAPRLVLTTVVILCVGCDESLASTVVTVRALAPVPLSGGSQMRQTATQTSRAANGISTSGTKFAPTHVYVLSRTDTSGLYANADSCQQPRVLAIG